MIDVSSKAVVAALKGVPLLIMKEQTVDETKSTMVCPGQGIRNHTFTIRSSASITGKIQLESASDPDYTGVWSPLTTLYDLSGLGAAAEKEFTFSNMMLNAVRARIETGVGSGNVSVEYTGN